MAAVEPIAPAEGKLLRPGASSMSKAAPKQTMRYCGRVFSEAEIESMRALIAAQPQATRAELSRRVCDRLGWKRVDGRSKEMS